MKHSAILFPLVLVVACSPSPAPAPSGQASEAVPPAASSAEALLPVPERDPPPILAPVPTAFRAVGTEPFWSADIAGAKLSYATPDALDPVTVAVERRNAGIGVVYSGMIDGKPIELEVRRETCSDGMSDTVYPLAVVRRIGPDSERGCAR